MKLLLISDAHGKTENIERLSGISKECDAVLFAGDYTEFNKYETAAPCVKKMRALHESVFSVIGNCDMPELSESLDGEDMSVEHAITYFEGLAIAGSGGGSKFTGTTPNERTEEELLSDFEMIKNPELKEEGQWSNLILISHNPPKDTLCDQCAPGVHVGSKLLSDFIKEIQPLAVLTGHIHEGAAVDKIGRTYVVNPGALAEGKYAVMEIEKSGGEWNVLKCELFQLPVSAAQ